MGLNLTDLITQDVGAVQKITAEEWASPCPLCGGTDRFRSWPAKGEWWCRRCEKRGDLITYLREVRHLSFVDAMREAGRESELRAHGSNGAREKRHKGRPVGPVQRWAITDDAVHCRQDYDDGTKAIWWAHADGRRYAAAQGDPAPEPAALPLYGSNRLPKFRMGSVVLVEGEKAADALLVANVRAVGTVCGASVTPHDDVLRDTLRGFEVYLWPDADDPGRRHMDRIGKRLLELGLKVPRLVRWDEAPEKADAADYVPLCGPDGVQQLLVAARAFEPLPEATAPADPLLNVAVEVLSDSKVSIRLPGPPHVGEITVMADHIHRSPEGSLVAFLDVTMGSGRPSLGGQIAVSLMRDRDLFARQLEKQNASATSLLQGDGGTPPPPGRWNEIAHVICNAVMKQRPRITVQDLYDEGLEERRMGAEWLVEPILQLGTPNILYGDGGSGKSLFALALLTHLALGQDFGEHAVYKLPTLPRPLLLDWEASRADQIGRLQSILAGIGATPVQGLIGYMKPAGPIWDAEEDIREAMAAGPYNMLMLDAAAGMVGGDLVNAESTMRAFAVLSSLKPELGSVIIAHTPESNPEKLFGSVFWRNEARRTLRVTSAKIDCGLRMTVFPEKQSEARVAGSTWEVQWRDDGAITLTEQTTDAVGIHTQAQLRVYEYFLRQPPGVVVTRQALALALPDLVRRSRDRALAGLVEAGQIFPTTADQTGHGRQQGWTRTPPNVLPFP